MKVRNLSYRSLCFNLDAALLYKKQTSSNATNLITEFRYRQLNTNTEKRINNLILSAACRYEAKRYQRHNSYTKEMPSYSVRKGIEKFKAALYAR